MKKLKIKEKVSGKQSVFNAGVIVGILKAQEVAKKESWYKIHKVFIDFVEKL